MGEEKQLRRRAASVVLGLAAMGAGLFAGTAACSLNCWRTDSIANGNYEIVDSPERPELVGATLTIADESVEIAFADAEGNDWTVRYAVTSRSR